MKQTSSRQAGDFVCTSRGKIFQNRQVFMAKSLKKRYAKSKIQKHWIHGSWACFAWPNHATYICKHNLMHKNRSCAENRRTNLHFFTKKSKTVFIARGWFKAQKVFQMLAGTFLNVSQYLSSLHTQGIGRWYWAP